MPSNALAIKQSQFNYCQPQKMQVQILKHEFGNSPRGRLYCRFVLLELGGLELHRL